MTPENEKIEAVEVLELTTKDFDKPGLESIITMQDVETLYQLKEYLTLKLSYMLENNYNKLVNTLYQIDIDEEKVTKLFQMKNRENIPSRLAEMIIQRQLQKLHFRKKYKSKKA